MCRGAPLLQWELEEARYLRELGHTWREVGAMLKRDHAGLCRSVRKCTEINASGGETETVGV